MHLTDIEIQVELMAQEEPDFAELAKETHRIDAQLTIVPDADSYLARIAIRGWKGAGRLSLLVMRPDAEPRPIPGLSAMIGLAKKTLMLVCNFYRHVSVVGLKSSFRPRKGPIRWVSDPVILNRSKTDLRSAWTELANVAPIAWVGVFGYVSSRKNLDVVSEAVATMRGVGLAVIGSIDPDAAASAAKHIDRLRLEGRLFLHSGVVSDRVFDAYLQAVDVVVAAHSNEGSSGIVAKAAAAGTPMVLAGARSLRRDAASIGALANWVPIGSAQIASAIAVAIETPKHAVESESEPGVAFAAALGVCKP